VAILYESFAKPFVCLKYRLNFCLQKEIGAKAALKMLVKLTPAACASANNRFHIFLISYIPKKVKRKKYKMTQFLIYPRLLLFLEFVIEV
jgi:hypothetical protein